MYHRHAHRALEWTLDEVQKLIDEEQQAADKDYAHLINLSLKALKKRVDKMRIDEYT